MKIKCPHCGAVNQDVTENDMCWQCGTILSAPTSALDAGGAPSSDSNPGHRPTPPRASPSATFTATRMPDPLDTPTEPTPAPPMVPTTIEREPVQPTRDASPGRTTLNGTVIAIIIAVILIAIIVAVMLLRPH